MGLATKCVEECDELILWFGEGKYVMKAMELKMLHQPLSPAQQQKYEAYMMRKQGLRVPEPEDKQDKNSEGRKKAEEDDIHVKPMDVGKYNTINLQKELAKSMEELMLNGRQPAGDPVSLQEYRDQMAGQENSYADQSYDIEAEDTGEMIPQEYDPAQYGEETYTYEDLPAAAGPEYPEAQMQPEAAAAPQPDYYAVQEEPAAAVQEPVQESSGNPDPDLSNYLSQEYDGQIGLVVPDGYQVERQITGQMNIEDIMKEWEKMKLENLTPEIDVKGIKITQPDINRPALQMAGYFEHYEATRLQIIGFVEYTYMESMTEERKQKIYNQLLSYPIPCIVFSRELHPDPLFLQIAKEKNVPILMTKKATSAFMAEIIRWLNVMLAPCISVHGVLVDVYGEGVLITGESGIGKSEAALELIKRGHRLVSDDVVEIRKVSDDTLIGNAPDITKHFIELRGIGIIDVKPCSVYPA